jgi:hypothetical protein
VSLKNLAALATAGIGVILALVAVSILTSGERGLLTIVGGLAAVGALVMFLRALIFYLQESGRRTRRR